MKRNKSNNDSHSFYLGSSAGLGILSDRSFTSLGDKVSEPTYKALAEMGFTKMTEIQAETIPHLLEGRDLVGAAKTGLWLLFNKYLHIFIYLTLLPFFLKIQGYGFERWVKKFRELCFHSKTVLLVFYIPY